MEMPLVPAPAEVNPFCPAEFPALETDQPSFCTIDSLGGIGATVWSLPDSRVTNSEHQVRLQLSPESHIVIGRANGSDVPYLDPRFVASPMVPGSGATVLRHGGHQQDLCVSRGHFMLRGRAGGILLINGVPRRGGGIRPPLNGTELLDPQTRPLEQAEELPIDRDAHITIRLPNGTRLTIRAE